jgi:glutathione S-transferase
MHPEISWEAYPKLQAWFNKIGEIPEIKTVAGEMIALAENFKTE